MTILHARDYLKALRERVNREAGAAHVVSRAVLGLDWYDTESQARRVIEYMLREGAAAVIEAARKEQER